MAVNALWLVETAGNIGSTLTASHIIALILSWWLASVDNLPSLGILEGQGEAIKELNRLLHEVLEECNEQGITFDRTAQRALIPIRFYRCLMQSWVWTCQLPCTQPSDNIGCKLFRC